MVTWRYLMEIKTAIKNFDYKRLNKSVYGGAHDAIIGEWINWWVKYCLNDKKGIIHSIINPAMQASFRGKPYFADILFVEHSEKIDIGKDSDGVTRQFYRVVGVAEIENDNSLEKLKHKVNSLSAYENCRDKKRRIKFPDLEFGILCTYYLDEDLKERRYEIRRIKEYMKQKSKFSNMQWVLYILKKQKLDDDYFFRVTGYARDPSSKSFYYGESFLGKPKYYIFWRGRQLRISKS